MPPTSSDAPSPPDSSILEVVAEKPSAQPQATVGASGLQAKIPTPADVGPKQTKGAGLQITGLSIITRDDAFYDKSLVIEASSLKTFCDNFCDNF